MAHKKGLGSSRNGRDSNAQRLGFKAFGGQIVPGGTIIVRQRGTRVKPGLNVGRGKDDTLFAKITGKIVFKDRGSMGKFVMVEPLEALKQPRHVLRRDPAAAIFDRDHDGAFVDSPVHADQRAVLAVARRVVEQVQEDLAHAAVVGRSSVSSARHGPG